jgi:CHAT domain-containing protein
LSACNTAAADGKPGAEGLSGLAKAFFYAGSQSLLVSHWAIETNAAKQLTTVMFEELKKAPGMGRSEALRRSMMVLAANDNTSHPAYWAPFSLVGEGAGAR